MVATSAWPACNSWDSQCWPPPAPAPTRLVIGIYIPLIVIATLCASRYMDNLTSMTNEKRAMRDVCGDRNTWVMAILYIGTFGSFIGLSFAFGQVVLIEFKHTFDTPIKAAYLTFLGPLIGRRPGARGHR